MNAFINNKHSRLSNFMCIMIYQNQTKQLNEITKAITNNTNAIIELSKKLGMEEKEDD